MKAKIKTIIRKTASVSAGSAIVVGFSAIGAIVGSLIPVIGTVIGAGMGAGAGSLAGTIVAKSVDKSLKEKLKSNKATNTLNAMNNFGIYSKEPLTEERSQVSPS